MAKYVYPAVFTEENNKQYSVRFPDIDGCFTGGENMADALLMASDALCLMLYDLEERNENIPSPSNINNILKNDKEFISLVGCDTIEYRKFYDNRTIKKTLVLPNWLNSLAEKQGINLSSTLQTALEKQLDL